MQERVGQPPPSLRQGHPPILSLRIHLFGDFWLEASETEVPAIEMPRVQSMLAYLLLHRTTPQSRAHLAFLHIGRQSLSWQPSTQQITWTLDVQDFERAVAQAEQAEHLQNPTTMRQAFF